jgi:hypothetical protein
MGKQYVKNIKIYTLNKIEKIFLESVILRLGYTVSDYRIVEYNGGVEMKILNKDLHRDFRTIRKTFYVKKNKSKKK